MSKPLTFLCIASYFKGNAFMKAAKEAGCRVLLLTSEKLKNEPWLRDYIDETFYVPGPQEWNMSDIIKGINYLSRREHIDRIAALDDFDVERGAQLREHLRIPGMGATRARFFRDKLAMRVQARDCGINVPDFTPVFNTEKVREFITRTSPPWFLKPRSEASATGIKKINSAEELWPILDELGDRNGDYLLEEFLPGSVYHADSLNYKGEVIFTRVSGYMNTPYEVAHGGGIFRSHFLKFGSKDEKDIVKMNQDVMKAFGMRHSASHTEFIKADRDGKFYFLETSSRVGGANIAELVEEGSGVNLWAEWAKIEAAEARGEEYELPKIRKDYSGIIISLAKQEYPDLSAYNDPEIAWRMNMTYHAGLIVRSPSYERVIELMNKYGERFFVDYYTSHPIQDKPSH